VVDEEVWQLPEKAPRKLEEISMQMALNCYLTLDKTTLKRASTILSLTLGTTSLRVTRQQVKFYT
jgi:hypothetical protein